MPGRRPSRAADAADRRSRRRPFEDALATVQHYSVPAPVTAGVALALVSIVAPRGPGRRRPERDLGSPAAAGVPMLIPYLSAAANGSTPLHPAFFAMTASTWAVLLARRSRLSLRRWSTTVPRHADAPCSTRTRMTSPPRSPGRPGPLGSRSSSSPLSSQPCSPSADPLPHRRPRARRRGWRRPRRGAVVHPRREQVSGLGDDRVVPGCERPRRHWPHAGHGRHRLLPAGSGPRTPQATRGEEQPAPLETDVPGIGTLTAHPSAWSAMTSRPRMSRSRWAPARWLRTRTGAGGPAPGRSAAMSPSAPTATYDDITLSDADRAVLGPRARREPGPGRRGGRGDPGRPSPILARLVPEDASAYDVGVAVQNYLRSAGGSPTRSPLMRAVPTRALSRPSCAPSGATACSSPRRCCSWRAPAGSPRGWPSASCPGSAAEGVRHPLQRRPRLARALHRGLGWTRFEPTPATRTGAPSRADPAADHTDQHQHRRVDREAVPHRTGTPHADRSRRHHHVVRADPDPAGGLFRPRAGRGRAWDHRSARVAQPRGPALRRPSCSRRRRRRRALPRAGRGRVAAAGHQAGRPRVAPEPAATLREAQRSTVAEPGWRPGRRGARSGTSRPSRPCGTHRWARPAAASPWPRMSTRSWPPRRGPGGVETGLRRGCCPPKGRRGGASSPSR